MMQRVLIAVTAVVLSGLCVGCGEPAPTGDVVETVEAEGTLTHQGKPLAYHQVTVMPNNDRPAVGITDESGRFVLGTNEEGDGAVAGVHPVAVNYVGPPSTNPEEGIMEFSEPPPPEVEIDKKYANPETSGLTVEIKEDGENQLEIDLE